MAKDKKYLLEVNAVGTLEELKQELTLMMGWLTPAQVEGHVAEKDVETFPMFYESKVLTTEIQEVAK